MMLRLVTSAARRWWGLWVAGTTGDGPRLAR